MQLTSDSDDNSKHVSQTIRDTGGVTEMVEADSDPEDAMSIRISKSLFHRMINNQRKEFISMWYLEGQGR